MTTGRPPDTYEVSLALRGFGTGAGEARAEVQRLAGGARLRRGLLGPAAGLLVAVAVLPVPIVHFAVPPIALVAGVVIGVRRWAVRELVLMARGCCPRCGRDQTLGLTGSAFRLPRGVKCHGCLEHLTLDRA